MSTKNLPLSSKVINFFWDAWCTLSIIGIWPRFIEPQLISITKIDLEIKNLPDSLNGLKILHFSDLHLKCSTSQSFLNKITNHAKKFNPDLIVFTGDFLCYASMHNPERLLRFLNTFKAPYGCFAIPGNHDYQDYISISDSGDYDILHPQTPTVSRGFLRLLSKPLITGNVTQNALSTPVNASLVKLLSHTPFKLLHNSSELIPIKGSFINVCGLGEHSAGRCRPDIAFQNYDSKYPGIILAHNPDSLPALKKYPGDIILCGHTHGGQVNLPYLRNKFMLMENSKVYRGLHEESHKWVYITRGLGSTMSFRWFSKPEMVFVTLRTA